MIEDGMIRIYNKTDERVSKVINGTRITVPAHGSANVSERKGRNMLESFPNHLTEDSEYERHQYTEEDIAKVDALDLDAAQACLRVMMSGQAPDFDRAVAETEERKNNKKVKTEQK